MFGPSRAQAREIFFRTWKKMNSGDPLEGIERLVADVILLHPDYHRVLQQPDKHGDRDYRPEAGEINPFLHMSLHLALEEQLSIDQPPGIRRAFDGLHMRSGDRHVSLHKLLDCLGEAVWRAQRDQAALDAVAYLACIRQASQVSGSDPHSDTE